MATSRPVHRTYSLLREDLAKIRLPVGVHDSGAVQTLGSGIVGGFGGAEIELLVIVQVAREAVGAETGGPGLVHAVVFALPGVTGVSASAV